MTANESRPEAANENAVAASSQSTVDRFLRGEVPAHELPWLAWLVWSDGFRAGCARMEARVAQAEADRDRYYYELNNSEEAKARHRAMLKDHAAAQVRRVMFAGTEAAHG